MKPIKALTLSLGELNEPVITRYRLGILIFRLYVEKEYQGESIGLQKDTPERAEFNRYLNKLIEEGVLDTQRGLPSSVFTLLGRTKWEVDEAACTIDPFAYISHLSAMAYYGLTDRIPIKLFISSPSDANWKKFAAQRMERDLGDQLQQYLDNEFPIMRRIAFKKLRKTEIQKTSSTHLGAYRTPRDKNIRVATIGRTFLDMLRNPQLCGGINHVLDVYDEHAKRYLQLITDEIESHGAPIDKVRAGYILDERLGVINEVVEGWVNFAQRGGSRKLDASSEYEAVWSDKWCISLNVY